MLRTAFLLAIMAGQLAAAEFSGRWAGTIETGHTRLPLYLTFIERDGNISGLAVTGANARPVKVENAELRGGELWFQVQDNANRSVQFRLSLSDGVLAGEATAGAQVSTVAVVQVGGGGGMRMPEPGGAGSGVGNSLPAGVFRVGSGVSAPVLIHKVEPEYTEEARKAKYQGTVLLYTEIAPDGRATNIKVQRSLGLGLDEKAIECVKQWRFKPGQKDGQPVTVAATIEINFRL